MLAILTTHPIQYQIPIWRALAERGQIPFKVYYMSDQGLRARHDPEFGRPVAWDIDLVTGYPHEFLPNMITGSDQSSFWWLRLPPDFGKRIASDGATVLWVQGWQVAAYWQAVWQASKAGLSTWMRGETNLRSAGNGWRRLAKDAILRRLFQRIETFLCVGTANKEFYISHGIGCGRLAPAPYCVDNGYFSKEADKLRGRRNAIRRRWGTPEDAICPLFVGKFISKKRPIDQAIAGQSLSKSFQPRPVHLLFVGTGELMDDVKAECTVAFDVASKVVSSTNCHRSGGRVAASFIGFLNQGEIAQAYVAADFLVLPSEATETWGLVVNEAMASGLPAVVSEEAGCCDDLIKPMRPDLCFPAGNISRLADAIANCVRLPPSAEELRTTIDRYDVLRTVEAVEELYRIIDIPAHPLLRA